MIVCDMCKENVESKEMVSDYRFALFGDTNVDGEHMDWSYLPESNHDIIHLCCPCIEKLKNSSEFRTQLDFQIRKILDAEQAGTEGVIVPDPATGLVDYFKAPQPPE